ncbi:MAG: HEAT repeat domain-containing protein [Gemmatimonadota bacterium]|nr:MAG: HEAT repeat domain-containing protein [Gemmatimonadota bacterium]
MTDMISFRPIGVLCALVLMAPWSGGGELAGQAGSRQSDLHFAQRLIAGARGTGSLMCEMALQSLDRRFGGWHGWTHVPDASTEQRDLIDWTSRRIATPEVVPILSAAISDADACVRRVAARLLGSVRHVAALEALLDRLRTGDDGTREMAAIALGFSQNRDAVGALIRSLADDAASVRRAAAWALGEIEDERAIDPLTRLLKDDHDASVRAEAARALGEIG